MVIVIIMVDMEYSKSKLNCNKDREKDDNGMMIIYYSKWSNDSDGNNGNSICRCSKNVLMVI